MSSAPQLENGFTPISNKLFETILESKFTLREVKIILTVIRYTNGFNRDTAKLSVRFLAETTQINLRHVQSTVQSLINKNVITVKSNYKGVSSREIQLNKDYDCWFRRSNKSENKNGSEVTNSDMTETAMSNSDMTKEASLEVTNSAMARDDQKSIQDIKKKTLKKTITVLPQIPDELLTIEGFNELWSNWITHRKEQKKPLTGLSAKIQLNKLVELKNKGSDVTELINAAIRNGWQGIWELNTGGYKYGGNTQAKSSVKSRLDYQFNNEKYRQREKELTELYG